MAEHADHIPVQNTEPAEPSHIQHQAIRSLGQYFAGLTLRREQVVLGKCVHQLADAKYHHMTELALKLDSNNSTEARGNILNLMRILLRDNDFIRIWRSVNGSEKPALALLHFLSVSKLMTVKVFLKHVAEIGHKQLETKLNEIIKNDTEIAETILNELNQEHLNLIVDHLSDDPDHPPVGMNLNWKIIASHAGLDQDAIRYLSNQSQQTSKGSLTIEFIAYLTAKDPDYTIAQFGSAIFQIGRKDVIQNCEIFKACLKNKCLTFREENNSSKANSSVADTYSLRQEIEDEIDANNGSLL